MVCGHSHKKAYIYIYICDPICEKVHSSHKLKSRDIQKNKKTLFLWKLRLIQRWVHTSLTCEAAKSQLTSMLVAKDTAPNVRPCRNSRNSRNRRATNRSICLLIMSTKLNCFAFCARRYRHGCQEDSFGSSRIDERRYFRLRRVVG